MWRQFFHWMHFKQFHFLAACRLRRRSPRNQNYPFFGVSLCLPFSLFFGVSLCLPFSFSPVFYPKPLVVAQQLLSRCSAVSQQLLSSFSAVAWQLLGCCSAITQHLGLHWHLIGAALNCIDTALALYWQCIGIVLAMHWHCIGNELALY